MCNRIAGHILRGIFVRELRTPPPTFRGRHLSCGACGGNLLLEPDEPVTPTMATSLIEHRTDLSDSRRFPQASARSA